MLAGERERGKGGGGGGGGEVKRIKTPQIKTCDVCKNKYMVGINQSTEHGVWLPFLCHS